MIVVEGPDGAGKSTMCWRLCEAFNLPLHERASHGRAGPVDNLFDWAYADVTTMADQPIAVYDRHPLLSEYVYGPIVKSRLSDGFCSTTAHNLIRMMARSVIVVLCRPPNERLAASVSDDRDMPGVSTNIERIGAAYDALKMFWPGRIVSYDYSKPHTLDEVMASCRIHVASEMRRNA